MSSYDCRAELFRERGCEVLGSVVQGTQMPQADPFDIDQIHPEARAAFNDTLARVRPGPADPSPASRILLIRGEAGCGKTHLIRSLRTQTHRNRAGVIAYVHMTSEQTDYRQYLLRQVVRSLSDPYQPTAGATAAASALDLISDALASALDAAMPGPSQPVTEALREADDATLARLVDELADQLSEVTTADGRLRFAELELNTLRILLYRQSLRKPIRRRVAGFLNGEPLSDSDWARLGAMPRDCDRSPMFLLGQLAHATGAVVGVPLVICIDQIEASDITGKNHDPFNRAMGTACELIENVPGLMVLLSCLDSAYNAHAPQLITAYRHRIENDPPPALLAAARIASEIRQIVSRRLKWLYESEGLSHVPPDSVYPLPEEVPDQLAGQHVRIVLQTVLGYWQKCRQAPAGELAVWPQDPATAPGKTDAVETELNRLQLAWNEFHTAGGHAVAEDDEAQLALLEWALADVQKELDARLTVRRVTAEASGAAAVTPALSVIVEWDRQDSLNAIGPIQRLAGLCDKDPRGGGLERQLKSLQAMRESDRQNIVVIRSTPFPRTGKAADRLLQMQQGGGRSVVMDEPHWQQIQALRRFLETRASGFAADVLQQWRKSDAPLATLAGITALVQPSKAPPAAPTTAKVTAPVIRPVKTAPVPTVVRNAAVARAGVTRVARSPVPPATAVASTIEADRVAPVVDGIAGSTGASATSSATSPATASAPASMGAAAKAGTAGTPGAVGVTPLAPAVPPVGPLVIGKSDGFSPIDIPLDPQVLTRHSAIFGTNGSGKTVLALTILEMLLERGISVTMFDRKGDLASYATSQAWQQNTGAPDEQRRRSLLKSRLDVHLFTPGSTAGRPLVLQLLPSGLSRMSAEDRAETARQAAMILCDVCEPTKTKSDMFAAVLARAVELLCGGDEPRSLDDLEHLLLDAPAELLELLPAHEARDCVAVGRRLDERRVAHGRLFSDQGEKLDLVKMLGANAAAPTRVRLNIISTQFLEGEAGQIWIAQFLAAMGRFIVQSPFPQGRLSAMLMFDEADQYIPVSRKPATKTGMDNLLRRARGAGVGVMLATQNVGDFDYKALDNITTVFAGKLTTARAIDKLHPRLGSAAERLAKKSSGQFVMGIENQVRDIRANMCLVQPVTVPREQMEKLAAQQRERS